MAAYSALIDSALLELEIWRQSASGREKVPVAFYDNLRGMLLDAKAVSDGEALYSHVDSANRYICDAGPLSARFLPSFKKLFLGLHALQGQKKG